MVRLCALVFGVLGLACLGGCRGQTTTEPESEPSPTAEGSAIEVDAPAVCAAGCRKLDSCVPELADGGSANPADISGRLAEACDAACAEFDDASSSLALADCLDLDSCPAYWGCISAAEVRPWLATIAPVGDRSCENLCSQASACAIAKQCALDSPDAGPIPGPQEEACMQDRAARVELEETCLLRCRSTSEDSRARTELIGCIDHGSCEGMLGCLESWAETDYGDEPGLVPGISPTCDAFCTRALVCGAEEEEVEFEPEQLEAFKQRMTSTYVECAVQCAKDLDVGGDEARAAFDTCTEAEGCIDYYNCALEV